MRRHYLPSLSPFVVALAALAIGQTPVFGQLQLQPKQRPLIMDAPTVSFVDPAAPHQIKLEIKGGPITGAPAGFTVQWMTLDEFAANGNQWYDEDDPRLYEASFTGDKGGVGGASNYNLGKKESTFVVIGESLFDDAGATTDEAESLYYRTWYIFRAYAHALPNYQESNYSGKASGRTGPCPGECITKTQGYWKNHYPDKWPQDVLTNGLTLGNVNYTAQELEDIFNTPAQGNGLISLAHQLIAAKLNIESFGLPMNPNDAAAILATIADADALIGNLVVPPVGNGFLSPADTSDLNDALTTYNEKYDCGD